MNLSALNVGLRSSRHSASIPITQSGAQIVRCQWRSNSLALMSYSREMGGLVRSDPAPLHQIHPPVNRLGI
jgi:hypothetical protein